MKNFTRLFLFSVLVMAFAAQGCRNDVDCIKGTSGERITREFMVDSFNAMSLWVNADVVIKHGTDAKVEIRAEESILNAINVESTKSAKLEIGRRNCFRNHKNISVTIITPSISGVELNGSGSIVMEDIFEETMLDVYINGSGEITARVKADKFIGHINGSGEMNVHGTAKEADYSITGSGDIYGFDLIADNCFVNISGSGDARVFAKDTLKVTISGSGGVHYKGHPSVTTNISGSGEVLDKN